jgi:hypothetical protein
MKYEQRGFGRLDAVVHLQFSLLLQRVSQVLNTGSGSEILTATRHRFRECCKARCGLIGAP